ncbi:hypothetical protein ACYOEI_38420, partial [Singulisphaera rosea]
AAATPSGERNVLKAKAKAVTAKVAKGLGETFTDRGGRVFRYVTPKKLGMAESSGVTAKIESGSNTFNFDVKEDGTVEVH